MTDREQKLWQRALRGVEQEELLSLEPVVDGEKDAAMAALVLAAVTRPLPTPKTRTEVPRRRTLIYGGAMMAAALALVLVWRSPLGHEPVPGYQSKVSGDDSELGPDAVALAPRRVNLDSWLRVELRPERARKDNAAARGYVLKDARLIPWSATAFQATADGTLRLKQRARDLPGLEVGEQHLVFAIGRAGKLPGEPEISRTLSGAAPMHQADFLILRSQVVVER